MNEKNYTRRGFTLVEMAIVLVVIGVLAGGVLMGSSLIGQARLRDVIGEIDKYQHAIHIFQEKYGELPGDYTRAEEAWGSDTNCPNTVFNTTVKTATCNGDGSGTIGSIDGSGNFGTQYEWYRMWQHLANAGLIEGRYSGVVGTTTPANILNTSVPKSVYITPGGYTVLYQYNNSATAELFAFRANHYILVGGVSTGCGSSTDNCITRAPMLTTRDAQVIDEKVDDGKPNSGKILARPSTSAITPDCLTGTDYKVSYTLPACGLMIETGV